MAKKAVQYWGMIDVFCLDTDNRTANGVDDMAGRSRDHQFIDKNQFMGLEHKKMLKMKEPPGICMKTKEH